MVLISETMLLWYRLLRRYDIAATYCNDTVMISSDMAEAGTFTIIFLDIKL